MSSVGEPQLGPELPPNWERLERAGEAAVHALELWRRRALAAEHEVVRLRRTLEELASVGDASSGAGEKLRSLQAENAALRSRMAQARKRVDLLLARLGTLEGSQ